MWRNSRQEEELRASVGLCYIGLVFIHENNIMYIKVEQSRNRSAVAQRVPGGLDSQIFMTFGT
jgi:hypothetical protein